jgi:hypothetical protein
MCVSNAALHVVYPLKRLCILDGGLLRLATCASEYERQFCSAVLGESRDGGQTAKEAQLAFEQQWAVIHLGTVV